MTRAVRVVALALWLCASACAESSSGAMWLQAVEASSTEAMLLERAGDLEGARAALEDALRVPASGVHAADARVVRQDLLYRLAMLEMKAGRLSEARRRANAGLELGRENDVFTANLLVARGQVLEADGDAVSASRDYHEALLINEVLLGRALGDDEEAR